MKVIPGSHAKGFLPMYTVPGETHHDRIRPEALETSKAKFVELDAGDILIFNQLLCHSSEECHSDAPRRAFRVSYQSAKEVFVPRGSPIVMRGGAPESMARLFPAPYAGPARRGFLQKAAGYLGRRLIRYGNPDLAVLAGEPKNPY
jgi:phytanoyl-CoA hydroxylase